MKVPEAIEALDKLVLMTNPGNRKAIEDVLDAVWLEAYEEGRARLFEPPEEPEPNLSFKCHMYGDREHTPCSGTTDDGTNSPCEHWCHVPRS